MKQTPSPLWLSLTMALCLAGCGSDFTANGVSTGGTGGQVPDLGEDDVSLPDDSALVAPNPPVAANQANQLSLAPLDLIWAAADWRLIQTAQGVQILPNFFEPFATNLGDKPEGMISNDQYVVLFGSNAQQSFYQILSVNDDGQPILSPAKAITGRIVQAALNDADTLDLLVEDYTGQTNTVGSYHLRVSIQAGVAVEPVLQTRLASKPIASAHDQNIVAWIAANKGGTQWLYVMDCPSSAEPCSMPPRPTMLGGKLPNTPATLRQVHPAVFVREGRVYVELVDKFGKAFMAVYRLQNGQLSNEPIPLTGTATPLITSTDLAAPTTRLSKFFLGGGGGLPPAVNPSTQATLRPTSTTWLSLRVEQGDEHAVFYPNTFAALPVHRVPMRGKAEGVYATDQLLIALSSTRQDTLTTLIAPNGSLAALTISTSRAEGRVDQLRVQQDANHLYIDELINQASSSSTPAYFARSAVDSATQTKGAASTYALPSAVLASAASEQWMVWLGQDDAQDTWIYPIFCTPAVQTCVHPAPIKLQGQLVSEATGMRSAHPDVKIFKDRLFVYSIDAGQRYLSVYAFEQNQLILVRRSPR